MHVLFNLHYICLQATEWQELLLGNLLQKGHCYHYLVACLPPCQEVHHCYPAGKKTNPSIPTTSCRQSRTSKSSVLKKRMRLHRECGSRLMGLLSHSVNRQRGILSSIDFVLLQLIVCRCPFPGILNHLT